MRIALEEELRFLSAGQITLIDELLAAVTPFGEIVLRLEQGHLSKVEQSKSYDAFKLSRPAALRKRLTDKGG